MDPLAVKLKKLSHSNNQAFCFEKRQYFPQRFLEPTQLRALSRRCPYTVKDWLNCVNQRIVEITKKIHRETLWRLRKFLESRNFVHKGSLVRFLVENNLSPVLNNSSGNIPRIFENLLVFLYACTGKL